MIEWRKSVKSTRTREQQMMIDFADIAMNLKTANERDLGAILELQKKAFHGQAIIYNDFNLPSLTQTIDDLHEEFQRKTFYKYERADRISASIRCYVEDGILFIEKLIVDPAFQNRGIGTFIMREIEKRYSHEVRRFALFTGDKSSRNLHLYKKCLHRLMPPTHSDACRPPVPEHAAH